MGNSKFQYYKSKQDKQFYFRFLESEGVILLTSEGYTNKASCENGINSVKANAPSEIRYERHSNNGHFWFNLKAGNGEIIGKSKMFKSATDRDKGIETLKQEAPGASTAYLD